LAYAIEKKRIQLNSKSRYYFDLIGSMKKRQKYTENIFKYCNVLGIELEDGRVNQIDEMGLD